MTIPEDVVRAYCGAGYGSKEIQFGKRPAVLVVDFQKGFVDPASPLGGSELVKMAVANTRRLLEVARDVDVPIVYLVTAFRPDLSDLGAWRIDVTNLTLGSKWAEVTEELTPREREIVIVKKRPSAFFGTELLQILISGRVDTTVITGCMTSGCVRATVVDSFSYGFCTIVPRECVGDQHEFPHNVSLFDIGNRYCHVAELSQVIEYLRSLSRDG